MNFAKYGRESDLTKTSRKAAYFQISDFTTLFSDFIHSALHESTIRKLSFCLKLEFFIPVFKKVQRIKQIIINMRSSFPTYQSFLFQEVNFHLIRCFQNIDADLRKNSNLIIDLVQKTTRVTTRDNTTQYEYNTRQHDTTRDNTTQYEYNTTQHETTRIQYDTTRVKLNPT